LASIVTYRLHIGESVLASKATWFWVIPSGRREFPNASLDDTLNACYTYITCMRQNPKQNVTVSLSQQTIRKAKVLAARRGSSISGLLAEQIEILVGQDEAYERAERQALALLDQGFHLGGEIRARRDEWHER